MAALMWISHSEWPLKVDEFCHAFAVEIESPNLNTDNVASIKTELAILDNEISTVRLTYFTRQEYLQAHQEIFGTPCYFILP